MSAILTTRRGVAGFGIFSLAMVALCVGLGVWQLQRRAEKHALIAALTERLAAARVYEFAYIFAPMPIKGATGAPGNAMAVH